MHYYDFNIGDYRKKTDHLTDDEDLAYRRLLDLYYDTEQPIPNETQSASRRLRMASKSHIVESILHEFFTLESDGCWHSKSCDERINGYHQKCATNKINGLKGGRPKKNPDGYRTVSETKPNGTQYQKPITNNQEPITPLPPMNGGSSLTIINKSGGQNGNNNNGKNRRSKSFAAEGERLKQMYLDRAREESDLGPHRESFPE